MSDVVRIPPEVVELSSEKPWHSIRLVEGIVPADHDVESIVLDELASGLEAIEIHIGGSLFHEIRDLDARAASGGRNLLEDALPLSKSKYMRTHLVFQFDVEHLRAREMREWVDEMETEEILSDSETEVYVGNGEYVLGQRVTRIQKPTGRKVQRVAQGAGVKVPGVAIAVVKGDGLSAATLLPVWQRVQLYPAREADYIARLFAEFETRMEDCKTVEEATASHRPFWCWIKNTARFQDGMAGLCYHFR